MLDERPEILECLRTTGDDCYVLKVAATSMAHLEEIVDALAEFGSTTTNLVFSRTLRCAARESPGRTSPHGEMRKDAHGPWRCPLSPSHRAAVSRR